MLEAVLRKTNHAVLLKVRARPGIKQKRAPRVIDIGNGAFALEVTVADQATEGKANKAIISEIAKWLGLKKADASIRSGQTSRIKTVEVRGEPTDITALIASCLTEDRH